MSDILPLPILSDTKSRSFIFSGTKNSKQVLGAKEFINNVLPGAADSASNLIWIDTYKTPASVENIRELNSFVSKTTYNNLPKVIVIDSVENLNLYCANALLKMLEEPAGHVYFILISYNISSVLKTIRSRCINLRFNSEARYAFDNDLYNSFIIALHSFKTDATGLYKFIEQVLSKKDNKWNDFKDVLHHLIARAVRYKIKQYSSSSKEEEEALSGVCESRSIEELIELYDYVTTLLYHTDAVNLSIINVSLLVIYKIVKI